MVSKESNFLSLGYVYLASDEVSGLDPLNTWYELPHITRLLEKFTHTHTHTYDGQSKIFLCIVDEFLTIKKFVKIVMLQKSKILNKSCF